MLRKRIAWEILRLGTRCHVLVHLVRARYVESLGCPLRHVLRGQPPSPRQVAQRLCNGGSLGGAGGSTAGAASTAATPVALLPWRRAQDKKVPGGLARFKISPTVKIIRLATLFRLASGVIKHV